MNAELIVEIAALGLAGWAAMKSVPRPPARDWSRLFHVTLSTVIRGRIETADGSAEDWERAVLGTVLYNPAARRPEQLVAQPDPSTIPTPALDGERALVERLAALSDADERWRFLFHQDHRVLDALFDDPASLGPAHDPASNLAPDVDWDDLAAWSSALQAALLRRLDGVTLVTLGDDALAEGLKSALPEGRVVSLAVEAAADAEALRAIPEVAHERLLLLARGAAAAHVLTVLADHGDLVDRLAGVVSIGGELDGPEVREAFTHERLEPEVLRAIPYFALTVVDPSEPLGRSWSAQRLPEPPLPPSGRIGLERIQLGAISSPGLDADALARALLHVVAVRHGA